MFKEFIQKELFRTPEEMLETILKGHDLYSFENEIYVFHYSEEGALCYCYVGKHEVAKYSSIAQATNEYWGAALKGNVVEVDEALDWCKEYYQKEWCKTEEVDKMVKMLLTKDAEVTFAIYDCCSANGTVEEVTKDGLLILFKNHIPCYENQTVMIPLNEPYMVRWEEFAELTIKPSVAWAMMCLDWALLDMGGSHRELVENLCLMANLPYEDVWEMEEDELFVLHYTAYKKMVDEKNLQDIESIIEYDVNEDNLESLLFATSCEYKKYASQTDTYKCLETLEAYLQGKKEDLAKKVSNTMSILKAKINPASWMGCAVGNRYYRLLDANKFGVITNGVATVGFISLDENIDYMFYKHINLCNAPEMVMVAQYKLESPYTITVNLKIGRYGYIGKSCIGMVGYCHDITSFQIKEYESPDKVAELIASTFNTLVPQIYKWGEEYPSLMSLLPMGEKVEQLSTTRQLNNRA